MKDKVVSPSLTPGESSFQDDETLNASTPEGSATIQLEPLTGANMPKKRAIETPVEAIRQTMLDNALDQGLLKGSSAPIVNVSAIKTAQNYGQIYPKTSSSSLSWDILLHRQHQRSCGSRPLLWKGEKEDFGEE